MESNPDARADSTSHARADSSGHTQADSSGHAHGHAHASVEADAHLTRDEQAAANASAWEERYSSGRKIWSGNPNALLVREAEGLAPRRVLDIGCGEGGDAIWLAEQGWTVVGIDIAQAALDLAAEHAMERGVGEAITWERHDLSRTAPAGPFDLVSACYFHSWLEMDRIGALRTAAGLVAPGGSLLVVGHAGSPSWVADPKHPANGLPSPEQVLADLALSGDEWTVVTSDARVEVTMKGPDGALATRPDNVLRIQRAG